ncbi:MAG: bifunctional diaminohydroxyphosphoribosylaminopyrimidine deaminase/5-amino-6-(5-phosphoribosylamino)uracil reductase RibD [Taibaiella sp.]|jgi:diaminohydroxyphosphoribosylaminopyrimidine deaminase/5-amino-6-(5-phosphoribosylamino)uracil reductase
MNIREQYMQRCIDLALKGAGHVSPNPMVGAVLVYNNQIIGEGWHKQYGQAHAEVNCIASVSDDNRELIRKSTLYVSLEPCAHYGKTPPCADLIVQHNIPEVIIGCTDSFKEVSGKGIAKLKAAGVKVTLGVLEKECRWLNRRFFTRQELSRPYIILKWAQSDDAFIAPEGGKHFMLSNIFSQKMVQKMRSEEDAILVGYNTALHDNPKLNNRYGSGKQPLRIVIDPELKLPHELQLFDQSQRTIVFNYLKSEEKENIQWLQLNRDRSFAQQIMELLKNINSIIIEGGSKTLQAFIDTDLWDEAVVFKTPHLLQRGTKAPQLKNSIRADQLQLQNDSINIYHHEHTQQLYRNQ